MDRFNDTNEGPNIHTHTRSPGGDEGGKKCTNINIYILVCIKLSYILEWHSLEGSSTAWERVSLVRDPRKNTVPPKTPAAHSDTHLKKENQKSRSSRSNRRKSHFKFLTIAIGGGSSPNGVVIFLIAFLSWGDPKWTGKCVRFCVCVCACPSVQYFYRKIFTHPPVLPQEEGSISVCNRVNVCKESVCKCVNFTWKWCKR